MRGIFSSLTKAWTHATDGQAGHPSAERKFQPFFLRLPSLFLSFCFEKEKRSLSSGKPDITTTTTTTYNEGHFLIEGHDSAAI